MDLVSIVTPTRVQLVLHIECLDRLLLPRGWPYVTYAKGSLRDQPPQYGHSSILRGGTGDPCCIAQPVECPSESPPQVLVELADAVGQVFLLSWLPGSQNTTSLRLRATMDIADSWR